MARVVRRSVSCVTMAIRAFSKVLEFRKILLAAKKTRTADAMTSTVLIRIFVVRAADFLILKAKVTEKTFHSKLPEAELLLCKRRVFTGKGKRVRKTGPLICALIRKKGKAFSPIYQNS